MAYGLLTCSEVFEMYLNPTSRVTRDKTVWEMASVMLNHPPLDIIHLSCIVFAGCLAAQNIYLKDVGHVTYPIKKAPYNKCMGPLKGSPGKTRTCDKSVNSRLLYQLSYRGLDCIKLRISSRLIRQRRKLQGIFELSILFYQYIFGNG